MNYPKLQAIAAVFLEYGDYLKRFSDERRKRYCKRAENVLERFTLSEVEDAAEKIFLQQPWPKLSYLPWCVAQRAEQLRTLNEFRDRPSPENCNLCDGDGLVTILHTAHALTELRQGREPMTPYTCVVCCTCRAGKWQANQILIREPRSRPVVFDPRRHVRVTLEKTLRDQWREVVERLKAKVKDSDWREIIL